MRLLLALHNGGTAFNAHYPKHVNEHVDAPRVSDAAMSACSLVSSAAVQTVPSCSNTEKAKYAPHLITAFVAIPDWLSREVME